MIWVSVCCFKILEIDVFLWICCVMRIVFVGFGELGFLFDDLGVWLLLLDFGNRYFFWICCVMRNIILSAVSLTF